MSQTSSQLKLAIERVLLKAASDQVFRQLALRDSSLAVKQAAGLDIEATELVFVEENGEAKATGTHAIVVTIPAPIPDSSDVELSDADMEHVSGGGDGTGTGVTWKP
jgi:hypothetical protein